MAMDLDQLITDFYNYFLGLYHQAGTPPPAQPAITPAAEIASAAKPSASRAFLAFESIGTPMTNSMFQLQNGEFDPGLVRQQFTLLANTIPVIDGTSIMAPGLLTVDGAYELMLAQAQPLTAADAEGLGHIKRSAQEAFDNASGDYSIPGMSGGFHPAVPTPPDWPMPSGATAWKSHSLQQSETVTVTTPGPVLSPPRPPPPREAPPIRPMPQWRWRVAPQELTIAIKGTQEVAAAVPPRPVALPPAQVLAASPQMFHPLINNAIVARQALAVDHVGAPAALAPAVHAAIAPAMALHMQAAAPAASSMVHLAPAPAVQAPVASLMVFRSDVMALHVQELAQRSTPQTVSSKNIKLSFDYCLVRADRMWMTGNAFLTARNWYVPHTKAGEISSGTGMGSGSFEVLPVAALVVRNLLLEADWSQDDTAVLHNSVKFGPFSLVGRTIAAETNAISCPGMQAVAWVFEPTPLLPPNGDPTLPA